jgi:hypothetical protein
VNAEDFISYLGKRDDDPSVKQLLAQLGVNKPPKLKRDEVDVDIELRRQGLILVFESSEDEKSSRLYLNDVQFYSGAAGQGMDAYTGQLPKGLTFDDSRDQVLARLGPPDLPDEDMSTDVWEFDGFCITVEYRAQNTAIGLVHVGAPLEDA